MKVRKPVVPPRRRKISGRSGPVPPGRVQVGPFPLDDWPPDDEGDSGVREPRRPLPLSPSGAAAIDPAVDLEECVTGN